MVDMTPQQAQSRTVQCLLSCVSTVTGVCPHREEAVLLRLLRTLTRVRGEGLSEVSRDLH